jgi:spore coat polysaccharide biosynthesis protein SpsF
VVGKENLESLAVIQARTSSKRLPGKVLKPVNGLPILEWQTKRVIQTSGLSQVVMATSEEIADDEVERIASRCGIPTVRGSLNDVFSRYVKIAEIYAPDILIRITGDCPLYMPQLCEVMLMEFLNRDVDYLSNTLRPTFPDGCDIEIFSINALRKLESKQLTPAELEHVTLGIYTRATEFKYWNFNNENNESFHRWTLDTSDDLEFITKVYENFAGNELSFTYKDVMMLLEENPALARYDDGSMRNSGSKSD